MPTTIMTILILSSVLRFTAKGLSCWCNLVDSDDEWTLAWCVIAAHYSTLHSPKGSIPDLGVGGNG